MTEDEMVGWHHQLDGHRFWWTLGVVDGQGGLVCCGSWSLKESETLFSWAPKSLQIVTAAANLKDACSLEETL